MTAAAESVPRRLPRARVPASIVVAIGAAWALSLAAAATGKERLLHQHGLVEHGPPVWAAALLFVVAWQAMLAAMMLPSSLPLIRLFAAAASRQEVGGRATAAFLGGYAAVWGAFGIAAFFADVAVHRLVDASSWLAPRPWLIGGSALLVAGAFQFSGLKDRCLQECRHPGPFLLANYRRGMRGGFRVGRKHGLFCLGCCWALMLVMFGLGVAVLWWMAALTVLMVYEKNGRFGVGRRAARRRRPARGGSAAARASRVSFVRARRLEGVRDQRPRRAGADPRRRIRGQARARSRPRFSRGPARAAVVAPRASCGRGPHPATFTMLDMDMPIVSASFAETGAGRYQASTPPLGMAGRWGLRVDVVPPHAARFTVSVVDEVGT